jgi:hypothetical protein
MVTYLSKYVISKFFENKLFFCFHQVISSFFSPDGTGEPNEEGLNYYNSLIDAVLDKGNSYKFQCNLNWCEPSVRDCSYLVFSIFLDQVCNHM